MRTEAPISRSLLSSRIFNAYGILRKTARLIEWMDGILDKTPYYKQEIEAEDPSILEEFRQILEVDTPDYNSYKTVTTKIQKSKYSNIDNDLTIHSWREIKPLLYSELKDHKHQQLNDLYNIAKQIISIWVTIQFLHIDVL